MVANTNDYFFIATWNPNCNWWRLCNSAIYLYIILEVMEQNIYKNILVIVSGFYLIGWIIELEALSIAAMSIGLVSIFFEKFAKAIDWLWLKLALGLGWVNSRILLTILFYVFLFPISLLARLFNGTSMKLKNQPSSMYHERNHLYTKEDLKDMW